MFLVDRDCVRRLLESPDPDAVLVYARGECVVVPEAQVDRARRGLVVASRKDLLGLLPGEAVTDEQLELLAARLDNVARDLGG
jgi:hypothetical protein